MKAKILNSILAKRERRRFSQGPGLASVLLGPFLFLCLIFPGRFSYPDDLRGESAIRREKLLRTIQDLAAPQMEGRGAGSAGEAKARQYIAREFRRIGLRPAKPLGSYFQRFEMTTGVRLGRDNRLVLEIGGEKKNYRPKISFNPFGFSDEGKTSGEPPPNREERGGYGAYFGSIPDFSESGVPGVRLSGVRPGSPAEKAGLRTGDIIVKLGGTNIRNLHDLLFALRSLRAGEEVEIRYLREGKTLSAHATLEERR